MIACCAYRPTSLMLDALGMTDDEKIGRVLRELIKRAGCTQADIAHRSGIEAGNLSRILRGSQSVTTARLRALGRVLEVEPWEIWRMADQGIPPATQEDPRKAALHALVDALDDAQLDDAFRRSSDLGQKQPPSPRENAASRGTQKKAG